MATGDSNSRKDIAWKYAYLADPNKKGDLTCRFCGKVAKGGAYRLKQHLVGNSTAITPCPTCPEHVKEEVNQYTLKKKREGKKPEENDAYNKELREKVRVNMPRWMYEAGISYSDVNFDSFKVAIQSISYNDVSVHSTEIPGTSRDAVIVGPSRDVTNQQESTEAVTVHPLNANVSHEQNVSYGGERPVKPDKLTEQPLSPKDERIVSANPSPNAVIVGLSRDVTEQQESTEAVGDLNTVHPLNAYVSHEQNVSYGGYANNTGILDGHSQYVNNEAMHVVSPVIYNHNLPFVFRSGYGFNPEMAHGQYSPVATQLHPLMMDGQPCFPQQVLFSPFYHAQASAPNFPHMSSAIPISPDELMLPENSSIDTMLYGPGSGIGGFGSFGGGNLSGNLVSSSLTSLVTYQPMGILGSYEHNAGQVIDNDNPSVGFPSCINPEMALGQYSPVATQLHPLMMDGQLYSHQQVPFSSSYHAQAPAPNLPPMSSAIPISQADQMLPENSSIYTMLYGPGSGYAGFGSFGGGNLSGNLGSSSLTPLKTYQAKLEAYERSIEQFSQQQRLMHGYGLMSSSFGGCDPHSSFKSITFGDASISYPVVNDQNRLTLVTGRRRERDRDSISIFNDPQDVFNDRNRGPRASKLRSKSGTEQGSLSVSKYVISTLGIHLDSYNQLDFVTDYENAKFFIIKSFSEDNIHKSIKYNVWASTPHGNKKLDAAYHEAKEIKGYCPVFLLFSVNASGQFCGVAEMVGPVDFEKDADYWQPDRWRGQFSVRWHIINDVPNICFRHILLESNDNKPVTHSRDSQEVALKEGIEMLKIFKDYDTRTSILYDFEYYDERERVLRERKARQIASSMADVSDSPADESVNQMSDSFAQALKLDERNNKEVPATEQGGSSRSDAPLSLSHDSVNQTSDSLADSFNRVVRLEESNNEVLASEKGGGHKN